MTTTKRLISVGSVLLASTMLGACSDDLVGGQRARTHAVLVAATVRLRLDAHAGLAPHEQRAHAPKRHDPMTAPGPRPKADRVAPGTHPASAPPQRQPPFAHPYGRSITDGCLDWDSSVTVLEALAEGVSERRLALGRG